MANRSLLGTFDDTYVLRLSRPGFDVLDPTLTKKELCFDSRWTSRCRLVTAGLLNLANFSQYEMITIPYGQTLADYPMVLMTYSTNNGSRWHGQVVTVGWRLTSNGQYLGIGTSSWTLRNDFGSDYRFRYWVFEII